MCAKVEGPLKGPHMFQLQLFLCTCQGGRPLSGLQVDEGVAKLHLLALGDALNVPTEEPTDYKGVKVKSLSCLVPQVRQQHRAAAGVRKVPRTLKG